MFKKVNAIKHLAILHIYTVFFFDICQIPRLWAKVLESQEPLQNPLGGRGLPRKTTKGLFQNPLSFPGFSLKGHTRKRKKARPEFKSVSFGEKRQFVALIFCLHFSRVMVVVLLDKIYCFLNNAILPCRYEKPGNIPRGILSFFTKLTFHLTLSLT